MPLEFTTVQKAAFSNGVKILIYGRAGAGKTRFCATAPKPIIISAEAGLLTYRKMIQDGTLDPNTPVIEVKGPTADKIVDEAYDWCRDNAAKHGIQTVCLDSISEIAERILAAEKAKTKDPRQAYGELGVRCIDLAKRFRDLGGLNCIVTAKQAVTKDPVTGVEKAEPTSPGQQVGPALPYLFDEVFHAFTDKDPGTGATYHAIRTHAAFNAEAKDRSGVLDEVEYPDATYLIKKMGG